MDEDYEKDYDEKEHCGEDDERDYDYDDGREETVEKADFTAKDVYDVLESVAYYNYISHDRYDWESECCCCGQTRQGGSILCEFCNDIWDRMRDIDDDARETMYGQIVKWIEKEESSFRLFFSVCFKDIAKFVKDDRKTEAVDQLVRCLREIGKMKLLESRYVDDLIQSIAQRWNLVEIS